MSTTSIQSSTWQWFRRLLSGQPHQVIGGLDDPYLLRWYVIPRNPLFNVYLHKFLRDDDPRALHDHPWWFVSCVLRGGYIEHSEFSDHSVVLRCRTSIFDVRSPFWHRAIAYRPATFRHRVALPHTPDGGRQPAWTLIVTGRRTRTWGFWCPRYWYRDGRRLGRRDDRFIQWDEFGDAGCGEA